MILFKYEHAARNWAYHQRKWFKKRTEVIRLKSETPEGARWGVKELKELDFPKKPTIIVV